jgi:hypothetical protein
MCSLALDYLPEMTPLNGQFAGRDVENRTGSGNVRLSTDALLPASLMLARWFGSIEGSGEVPLGA